VDKWWWWAALILGVLLAARKFVNPVIDRMAKAIQQFEGWHEGSVSWRNNNPGNIKDTHFPGTVGHDDEGHAIFDSFASGWNALVRKLENAFYGKSTVYLPTFSLYEFFRKWAEGNSREYAEFVATALGVTPETTLAELLTGGSTT
jgi:hypothetical protein